MPSPKFSIDHAYQQALTYHRSGQLQNAIALYRQILAQRPSHPGALHMLGIAALSRGAFTEAQNLIGRAAQLLPQDPGVHVNLALALTEGGKPQEGLEQIEKALALNPQMVAAQLNRVAILIRAERYAQALEAAQELITAGHDHPDLLLNRGIALVGLDQVHEAIECFEQLIAASPKNAKALNNLGDALIKSGQWEAAITAADRALAIDPRYTGALLTKARALAAQGLLTTALPFLQHAVEVQPANLRLRLQLTHCLLELQEFAAVIAESEKMLAIDALCAEAYVSAARALTGLNRIDDALESYHKANEINPNSKVTLDHLATLNTNVCNWDSFYKLRDDLYGEINFEYWPPLTILAETDDPSLHLRIARSYLQYLRIPQSQKQHWEQRKPGRIRVGYFSSDFYTHATMVLMMELFESHSRDIFEIHIFSYGSQVHDAMRDRVERSVEHFHDVSNQTDAEIATLSREIGIDIAIDLKGFTRGCRLGIFAKRCAPVQVSYLGYPGTTGADFMDYVIADRTVLPPQNHPFFTEAPVYMPHSYQVNDSRRAISARKFTHAELGLPDNGFVFCCFNSNYKVTPDTFDIWMRMLKAVPGSVLWLLQGSQAAIKNLELEAERRGVSKQRLVFAKHAPLDEHLARHSAADLFIDTLPYNAHTTTSDALWAGLPVLTLAGQAFAGRVAASLLAAVGLPELITYSPQEYEAKAIHLATHPEELTALRSRLRDSRTQAPLFDGRRFTHDLEKAYQIMFERQQAGLPHTLITV